MQQRDRGTFLHGVPLFLMAYRLFLMGLFRPPVRPDASVFGGRQWVGARMVGSSGSFALGGTGHIVDDAGSFALGGRAVLLAKQDHSLSGALAVLLAMHDHLLSGPLTIVDDHLLSGTIACVDGDAQ